VAGAIAESLIDIIQNTTMEVIEVRNYEKKANERDNFHNLFLTELKPMLERWNIAVVAFGKSLHDENSYYLIRSFKNIIERSEQLNGFYNSEEWLKNYDSKVMSYIVKYTTSVLPAEQLLKISDFINK